MRYFETVKEDIYRIFTEDEKKNGVKKLRVIYEIITRNELWVIISYRAGRWIITNIKNKWLRKIIIFPWSIINKIIVIISGNIHIYLNADIGKGLYLHYGPMWIGPVKIGEYCNFSMMNVIGFGGRGEKWGVPEIGDRVFMGPGAIAVGKIKIGNNVAVGANSVVVKDIPDNCSVGGVPAKIISQKDSGKYIEIRK